VAPADASGAATPCAGDGDCPAHFTCPPGDPGARTCTRQSCAADSDCGTGDCVLGSCYDSLGSCVANAP